MQSLMKLISVNDVNVCKLVSVPDMDVFSTLLTFGLLTGRWTTVGFSYKHYCHLLTVVNSLNA